ncbi:MAG: hypothetical protein ACRYFS_23230 [Janthinobacterium lividum]
MAQQFESSLEPGDNLRSQRMTADESRAVIDLWQQEQTELTGLTDKPAVPDVAEGLDISVEDVQRLLQTVRAKRVEDKIIHAAEQELADIHRAEEERRIAENRRQQAEAQREQAESRRRGCPAYPVRSISLVSELPPRYIVQEMVGTGYKMAGLALCIAALLFVGYTSVPPPPQATDAIAISHASATYDTQGQVKSVDMTCADNTGKIVTCDADIIATEKQYFQDKHDKQVADEAVKAEKESHDKQAHR